MAAFGAWSCFHPAFGEGNTAAAIVGASVAVWVVHPLALRGIQGAAVPNPEATAAKVLLLPVFIMLVAMAFQVSTSDLNHWGDSKPGAVLVSLGLIVTVDGGFRPGHCWRPNHGSHPPAEASRRSGWPGRTARACRPLRCGRPTPGCKPSGS